MTEPRRLHASRRESKPTAPQGYFDGVIDGEAVGWCWLPDDPSTRVTVEVRVDGDLVAQATASRRRDSVARAGFGDGCYGFNVPLPESLDDGGTHRILVLAAGATLPVAAEFMSGGLRSADGASSPEGPWATTRFMAANEAARESGGPVMVAKPPSEIRGYVEGVSGNELFGWVVDPTQSDASVEVEARFDGISLGRMVASLDRPDVARAGHGAAHGFRFALPAPPEAGDHTVEVRTVHGNLAVALEKAYVVVTANGATVEGIKLRPATHTVAKPLAAPREVLLGRDGWLFEWPGLRTFHILRGADECPAQFVAAHLERVQEREAAVGDAGGTLLEAIIPSKLAVYPEHLPAGMSVDFSRRPADLVVAAARDLNTVDVVDLQAPLRHAKARDDVITRTGRGLTWTGAFAAYRSLAKQLALRIPSLEPLPREALKLGELELVADSLIALPRLGWTGAGTFSAAVGAEEEQEGEPRLEWSSLSTEYAVIEPALAELTGRDAALLRPRGAAESADATASDRAGGTALLIHDGSAARLAPFLAEHFDLTLVIVAAGDIRIEPLLTELRPTAVVEVVAEQTLLAGALD